MTYWFLPSGPSILIIKSWLQVYSVSLTVVYFKMCCMENNLHQNPLEVQLINNAHLPHGDLFCLYLDSCKVLAERETASQKEEIC